MLFMFTGKVKPENRKAFVKRGIEKGQMLPEGMKLVGHWASLGTGKTYVVAETDDPIKIYQLADAWSDLAEMDIIPVMDIQENLDRLRG